MTPAQEFREARDWLSHHKRDPFLWLIILMTVAMFALNFGVLALLASAFPPSDAGRAIGLTPPFAYLETRIYCKVPRGMHLFGYVFDKDEKKVRVCRDMLNGGWVFGEKK